MFFGGKRGDSKKGTLSPSLLGGDYPPSLLWRPKGVAISTLGHRQDKNALFFFGGTNQPRNNPTMAHFSRSHHTHFASAATRFAILGPKTFSRLPSRGIAGFFIPKGHENRNFRRKNDSCPTSDNLLFGVFSSFLRVFSPVGTPRICKKVPFSGRSHPRRKDVNLKKTTTILPFFVPPGDESSLMTEL